MTPIIIAVIFGLVLFALLVFASKKLTPSGAEQRTRNIVDQIAAGTDGYEEGDIDQAITDVSAYFKDDASPLARFLIKLPGAESLYSALLKAGHVNRTKSVLLIMLALFVVLTGILWIPLKFAAPFVALALAYYIPKKYFQREIKKRNRQFINMFPEAIDMIVRSVKSGHPLNTALRMIADNMEDPIGAEFRQLVNEIAYGRPLVEALRRLSKRVDEQDVHFFVVVLAVQQETGGNLAEILQNLSNVIRGRKRLYQKIQAMTSEGRATLLVLGGLPVLVFTIINFTSPDYMTPLYNTPLGNIILGGAFLLIGMAIFIINRMIDIDI